VLFYPVRAWALLSGRTEALATKFLWPLPVARLAAQRLRHPTVGLVTQTMNFGQGT
jgi:hypothetical protein